MSEANSMMPLIIIPMLWAAAFAGVCWYAGRTAVEITYVTLADGRRQERRLPLLFRLLLPFTPNLQRLVGGPAFAKSRKTINGQIVSAGFEGLIDAHEFLALRLLIPMVIGPLLIGAVSALIAAMPGPFTSGLMSREVLFAIALLLYLYLYPWLWLKGAVRRRHASIERALPFVLDLLTLSVEAGLDFMTAIQRIIDRRKVDPLAEELIRMFREVQLGKTRRESLRDMATRCGQRDIRTVVNALVQADRLGVSIGAILGIQARQMRTRRFQRAEKMANQAPVKMLFPLVAFIFPSVFIVLLGPVILQLIRNGL